MAGFNFSQNIIGLDKVKGDVQEIALEISQLSASTLPYSSTQSTKEAIDEAMYYKAGDTYEIQAGYQQFLARLGWSRARVIITFSLPKVVKGNLIASNIILPPTIAVYAKDEGRTCTITNIGVNSIQENIISLMIDITPSTAWSADSDSMAIVEMPSQTGVNIKFTFS